MQVPKRHIPLVGLLGLVVVLAAGGGIYYYQFVISHAAPTYVASHRLIFINATIVDTSTNGHGFRVTDTAFLNQTNLPSFNATQGGANMTGVKYSNYKGESDNSTIDAHPGDMVTFYIFSKNVSASLGQYTGIRGHGFEVDSPSGSVVVPNSVLTFGQWYTVTVTFTDSGLYLYKCTIGCSNLHYKMNGNINVS